MLDHPRLWTAYHKNNAPLVPLYSLAGFRSMVARGDRLERLLAYIWSRLFTVALYGVLLLGPTHLTKSPTVILLGRMWGNNKKRKKEKNTNLHTLGDMTTSGVITPS